MVVPPYYLKTLTSVAHIVVALCALLLFGCTQPQLSSELSTRLDEGVLRVGTMYGRTTYYQAPEGPRGFEYELTRGFADYLGIELKVYPFYSYDALLEQLSAGTIDIIAAGDVVAGDVKQRFVFGPPYQQVSQKLVFRQGNTRPRKTEDLVGPVVVVAGSSHAHLLGDEQTQSSSLSWQTTNERDADELLAMVASGEIDYTLADTNRLAMQRRRYPQLSVGFTMADEQPIAWVMNPDVDDSLRAAAVEYFGIIRQNGTFNRLEEKYFGHVRQFNYVDTKAFIQAAEQRLPVYQSWFEEYAGDIDWRLIAAMSYQESHWREDATSPTGVRGLMMLTLDTASDMDVISRIDAEQAIRGGAQYFASLKSRIPARISEPDKTWMALAAYNIGLGHLEDARIITQREGGNPDLWVDVKQRLPLLSQKSTYRTTKYGFARGDEALQYVENIRRYYDSLVWLDDREKLQATTPPEA